MMTHHDLFGARTALETAAGTSTYYRLEALTGWGVHGLDRLPFTVKILLENVLRHADGELVNEDEVLSLARWVPGQAAQTEALILFTPRISTTSTVSRDSLLWRASKVTSGTMRQRTYT